MGPLEQVLDLLRVHDDGEAAYTGDGLGGPDDVAAVGGDSLELLVEPGGVDVAYPLGGQLGHACAGPSHYAADVLAIFSEEHVSEAGHAGVTDVPADYLLVEVDCLIHVVGYEFVPDEAICHFCTFLSRRYAIK